MAMIECKSCGKMISEKADVCPFCNTLLKERTVVYCEECGTEIPPLSQTCPNCGCPRPSENQKLTTDVVSFDSGSIKKGKKKVVIICFIIILTLIAAALIKSKRYSSAFDDCVSEMFSGALIAEETATLIHDVWYNCIYEEKDPTTDRYTITKTGAFYDDFNDAISNLYSDILFNVRIEQVKSSREKVSGLMKKTIDPPKKYEAAHEALCDLYEAYCDITNCAIDPSGSLLTYTSTFNAADSNFSNRYETVKMFR